MLRSENIARASALRASIRALGYASLLVVTACTPRALGKEEGTPGTPQAPAAKVTAAQPIATTLTEFSEHTGRTEAPESVEIRARASGHLTRASFREGDLVKQGDLLFVIDPRPYQSALARAKAELASARADHELAIRDAASAEQLHQSNTIPERQYDRQKSRVAQLEARVAVAQAALDAAALDLEYAYVRSPVSGRIGRTLVTRGNLVGPSLPSPLTTVVSVNPLHVYVDVDEARGLALARALSQGGSTVARIGYPGEAGYPHEARIDFVDNHVDAATGTLKVRAVVDNPDGTLTHGLFARVRLPEGKEHGALLVSDRAIATDQDRRFVWVVDGEGKATYRAVKLGPLEDGLRVVRDGLSKDDKVIVRGLQRVRPGAAVNAELVAMRDADGTGARSPK
ncbi:MAG: efflux RND transporter periplasmic adaptor subunit [Polyangiales bacterium]